MKSRTFVISVFLFLSIACQVTSFGKEATPTANINATVDAAVAATDSAEALVQSTVDSAVAATITALPPHPSPTPVDPDNLSEEELATAVDTSVQEANDVYQQTTEYSNQATSDGTLTYDEAYALAYYYGISQAELEEALYLAELYLSLYYELAEETVELLTIVVEDLEQLAAYTTEALTTLDNVISLIEEGSVVDLELISSLADQSETIKEQIKQLETQSTEWMGQLRGSLEIRSDQFTSMEPNQVAGDRIGALNIARDYLDTINKSLGDGVLSRNELLSIAQLGANASASINQFGGPQLQHLSGNINSLTGQLARGELPQAKISAGELGSLIPRR